MNDPLNGLMAPQERRTNDVHLMTLSHTRMCPWPLEGHLTKCGAKSDRNERLSS